VTSGPIVRLWRQARKSGRMPTEQDLEAARRLAGWRGLALDASTRTARLTTAGMKLDLGGIAKGYAGDCALAALRRAGIGSALCEAGGDIVAGDPPPGRPGWTIGIAGGERELVVANAAVSTSGDTEQFVVIGGTRYSHVVDPRTGLGLTSRVAATVLAPAGLIADGLATAASVLGPEAGARLAAGYPGVQIWFRKAP